MILYGNEDPITIKFEELIENQLKVLEHYLSLKCAENNKNLSVLRN